VARPGLGGRTYSAQLPHGEPNDPKPSGHRASKELKAAGERGRTVRAFSTRLVLDRMAKGGFVVARPIGLELVQYRITQRGRDAIQEYDL
jgi:hypothetical protein